MYNSTLSNKLSFGGHNVQPGLRSPNVNTISNPDIKKLYDIADGLALARSNEITSQSTTHNIDKNNFIKAIAKKLFNRDWQPKAITHDSLKRKESAVGASLFYTGRPNERIEFFNDSQKSWFFYQSITDASGVNHSTTLHYEVHPNGIMRVSNKTGMKCEFVHGQEYENFVQSANLYYERVMKYVYNKPATLDKKLV